MSRRSLLRVMLAEDFLPWRRYLISRFQDEPDLEIARVAADRLEAIQKSEVLRGVYKRPVKITFGEFGKRYMEYAKTNKRSWLRDQQMLEHLTGFFGNERQLTDLTTLDIEGYKVRRRSSVSGSTLNRELALLKHMFRLAIDWDLYMDLNPVRRVKYIQEFNIGTRVAGSEEEEKLIQNAAPFLQDLIRFDLNTGLRVGELFSLRWFSVDLDAGILNVFAPKTQKTRAVPINPEARRILEAWALNRKNEFVFYNQDTDKPFVDLKAGFALACKKAGITGVTWHILRHTFASRLLALGVDIVTVQQLLGHSTLMVTMRYLHTNLDSKRAAVEKLAGYSDNLVTVRTRLVQLNSKMSQTAS